MKPWFTITNKADEPAEILLYGEIGTGWDGSSGVDAKAFANELEMVPRDKDIKLRIHSPGGSVFDGLAIFNLINARRDHVTAHVDGVALSAASFIAMAAKTVVMPKTARMMIHDAQGFAIGDSESMKEMAELLDRESDNIAAMYASKTGKPASKFRALMRDTTWLNGDEAKALGLADVVTDSGAVKNDFDMSRFKNIAGEARNISAPSQGADKQPLNQKTTMKDTMIALLNKRGVQIPENATDEQLLELVSNSSKPPTTTTPPPATANADTVTVNALNELAGIKAQLKSERDARVTNEFNAIAATRPHLSENRETFLNRCLADETILKDLKAFPETALPANGFRRVTVGNEGILDTVKNIKNANERYKFRIANWTELDAAYLNPRNANTTDAALVTDMLLDGATTILQNRLAPLRAFSKEVATDRVKPKAILQHRKITAGGTAQVNATSFEDTTNFVGTEENVAITINQITSGGHVTNAERQSGVKMSQWVDIKVAEFSDKIMAAVAAVILEGTYTATPLVSAAAAFGSEEMKTLWGQLKKSPIKNIILDGEYFARFIPSTLEQFNIFTVGIPGWDTVALNTNWTGATANTVGFACNPQAMVCGIGLPLRSERANLVSSESVLNLPDLGLSVAVYNWYSNITRNEWMTMDIMFGAAANDTTAGVLIKSA